MISLSNYKDRLLQIVRLQMETGAYIDVVYKGQLYRMHVENLHQKVKLERRGRKAALIAKIATERCKDCRKLVINNVCTNSLCPSNLRGKVNILP